MEKVIFTAIAMIAFSGASMANTKEEKTRVVTLKATKVVKKVLKRTPCDALWIQAWQNAGGAAAGDYSIGYADGYATAHGC